ncbi:MAG: hypothetical protein ACJA2Q_001326 [Pseudohongiellaceae bacterium]|jgi:hypothetical protein
MLVLNANEGLNVKSVALAFLVSVDSSVPLYNFESQKKANIKQSMTARFT